MSEHKKVAVFAWQNNSFIGPILRELSNRNTIVKQIPCTNNDAYNYTAALDLLHWADYAFFDFLHTPLTWASSLSSANCRITARLHGIEVYDPAITRINWPGVHLITSAPQMLRWKRMAEETKVKSASENTINLGVNVAPTAKRKEVFGFNIALTAATPLPRKRLYTTIESFIDLLRHSPDKAWMLHIRGIDVGSSFRQAEANEYVKFIYELEDSNPILEGHLFFYDHMDDAQWQHFLGGMDAVISNSMQEGYHLSTLEAMSYGAMPFVHRWLGADHIYPSQSLFTTQRELVDMMIEWGNLPLKQKQKISLQVQNIVKENHDENILAKQAVDVILGV